LCNSIADWRLQIADLKLTIVSMSDVGFADADLHCRLAIAGCGFTSSNNGFIFSSTS